MPLYARLAVLLLFFGVLVAAAPQAQADSDVLGGVRLGYYADADSPSPGGELLFKVLPAFYFNPNVEFVLQDDSYITVNGDFHYDFPRHGDTMFWAGAGLAVISVNPPGPASGRTDAGLNLLAGAGLGHRRVIPYLQAKVIVKDSSELALAAGLRF